MSRRQTHGAADDPVPARQVSSSPFAPARWKHWLLTSAAIYPVITVLALGTDPVLRPLPLPARLAVLIPVTVAIMQWLLLPYLHRRLEQWLTR